jgi:hypothetical protein
MNEVDGILEGGTNEILRRMLNNAIVTESLTAVVQYKLIDKLSNAIEKTGSELSEASTALMDSSKESVETLKKSIDDFRRSNEKTSNVLIVLTAVIGLATLVQAFYAIMLLFKQ